MRAPRCVAWGLGAMLGAMCALTGCGRFTPKPADKYVYVTAKQTFLRDRVAAVSNRTGTVTNGEKLVVVERARRFVKVRTPDGAVGWIEEKLTAGQDVADEFEGLAKKNADDPVVATATARDEVYLHIAPGKETERFYRLAEGDQLSLLERATVVKPGPPGPPGAVVAKPAAAIAAKKGAAAAVVPVPVAPKTGDADKNDEAAAAAAVEVPMEDWWLVRDAKGQMGWIYSRMIDVAIPDTLSRYAEGQRIVGAYLLGHADDPESGILDNGNVVSSIPEYVTVLGPYKAGLPYDFDQVRVFTWNTKKHRYETAFREHNIEGYLPVTIAEKTDPYGKGALAEIKLPTFSYRVLAAESPTPVPDETGILKPAKTVLKTYRREGNICRRILAPGTQAPAEAHPVVVAKKEKGKGKKGKK